MDLTSPGTLSALWLHEPTAELLALANSDLQACAVKPAQLAEAYSSLLLLNIFPYGSVFTDPRGELGGESAEIALAAYRQVSYAPDELSRVAAADHVGLCLGYLAHCGAERAGSEAFGGEAATEVAVATVEGAAAAAAAAAAFSADMYTWIPVLCLAVERDPSAHRFYRELARQSRACVLKEVWHGGPADADALRDRLRNLESAEWGSGLVSGEREVHLGELLHFFLTPARCGAFFSRAMLGNIAMKMGVRLPFGGRFEVARSLFAAAGEGDRLLPLLELLGEEARWWGARYGEILGWEAASAWRLRIGDLVGVIEGMRGEISRLRIDDV